jgi:very-short-patch-repair endonuclease
LLRDRKLGAKFRRPCRLENWIVDSYGSKRRLAIELEESVHSQPRPMRRDAVKDDFLRTLGMSLKRMPNGLVMDDREESVRRVREAIKCSQELTPHPSRSGW